MIGELYNNVSNGVAVAGRQVYNFAMEHPVELTVAIAKNILPLVATAIVFQDSSPGWSAFAKCEVFCVSAEHLLGGYPASCLSVCWAFTSNFSGT